MVKVVGLLYLEDDVPKKSAASVSKISPSQESDTFCALIDPLNFMELTITSNILCYKICQKHK